MRLKHKKTGEVVTVVPHIEPLRKGYALGLGNDEGISIKRLNGNYAFIKKEDISKYFEEVLENGKKN